MKLIRHQITLFFPKAAFGNLQGILRYFIDKAGKVLDGQPVMLPIPEGAPDDIPRIILRSSDNSQELLLKTNRIDIALTKPIESGITESKRTAFEKNAIDWLVPLVEEELTAANRVGVVMQRAFAPPEGTPGEYISRKYCREEYLDQPFRNAKNFEVHCLKNYQLAGRMVNSWVRIQTLTILPANTMAVGVLNDINHVPTPSDLRPEEIREFIDKADTEAKKILSYYKLEL